MKKANLESKKKKTVKEQIKNIQSVFDMTPAAIKKHPQLKKLQEYAQSADGKEKYAVGNGDTYYCLHPRICRIGNGQIEIEKMKVRLK